MSLIMIRIIDVSHREVLVLFRPKVMMTGMTGAMKHKMVKINSNEIRMVALNAIADAKMGLPAIMTTILHVLLGLKMIVYFTNALTRNSAIRDSGTTM